MAAIVVVALVVLGGVSMRGDGRRPATASSPPSPGSHGISGVAHPDTSWRGSHDPAGDLVLEGQVLDDDDQPVGGATVVVDSRPSRTVTTEDDGSFSIDGLAGRTYQITASHASGVAGPVTVRLDAQSDPVVLRLQTPGQVTVRVIDAGTLAPIAGATVEVRTPILATAETGDDGSVTLSPVVRGHWNVVARATDRARAHGAVIVGEVPASITLALEPGYTVHGRVVDESGAPVAAARVWAISSSDWTDGVSPDRDGVLSGDDGSFVLSGLSAGTYRLWGRARGFAPGSSAPVTAGERSDATIVLASAATLRGRVLYTDGSAAAGAVVRAFLENDTAITHTTADGSFVMTDLPRTTVKVLAEADAASCWSVPVDLRDGKGEVTLRLDLEAAISGVVVDSEGEPIEAAQVDISLIAPGSRFVRAELTDGAGQFRIGGLPEGDYEIVASRPGIAPAPSEEPVRAHTGTSVRIVLRSPGSLIAQVAFADGGSPKLVTARLGAAGEARAFVDGEIAIAEISAGRYELRIEGPDIVPPEPVRVSVTEGRETDLGSIVVERGRTIDGVIVDAGGAPVANAEVMAAPVLVGTGAKADSGSRAPAFQGEVKRVTSDASGAFRLRGLAAIPLVIVANHATAGRSQPVTLDPTARGPLRLTMTATASIAGTITLDGRPVRGVVAAQPHASPLAMSVVLAGADGAFHFDRVSPGQYSVSAIVGDPLSGAPFAPTSVEVEPGKRADVTLAAVRGTRSLHVTTDGRSIVFVTTEPAEAVNAYDLVTRLGTQTRGHWAMTAADLGAADFTNLEPVGYTVCAVPIDRPVADTNAMLELVSRRGTGMAVRCRTVAAGDATAALEVP